jgi:hypothetical protein
MNYLGLLLLLAGFYYLINLENKSIVFLVILVGVYIYYEGLLPDTFWMLPSPTYKDSFEFGKLDKLVREYKKGSPDEDDKLKHQIQQEINTIYFSFPYHEHKRIDNYLYRHYGFEK